MNIPTKLVDSFIRNFIRAAVFLEESPHPSVGSVIIMSEVIDEDIRASIFTEQPVESMNLSVIYTFIDTLIAIADKAKSCPCEHCCTYRAKIALIRQITNPN